MAVVDVVWVEVRVDDVVSDEVGEDVTDVVVEEVGDVVTVVEVVSEVVGEVTGVDVSVDVGVERPQSVNVPSACALISPLTNTALAAHSDIFLTPPYLITPPPAQRNDTVDSPRENARIAVVNPDAIVSQSGFSVSGTLRRFTAEAAPGIKNRVQPSDPVGYPAIHGDAALLSSATWLAQSSFDSSVRKNSPDASMQVTRP